MGMQFHCGRYAPTSGTDSAGLKVLSAFRKESHAPITARFVITITWNHSLRWSVFCPRKARP